MLEVGSLDAAATDQRGKRQGCLVAAVTVSAPDPKPRRDWRICFEGRRVDVGLARHAASLARATRC
jgi:hypothetical protein